jgi:hypothetical protein
MEERELFRGEHSVQSGEAKSKSRHPDIRESRGSERYANTEGRRPLCRPLPVTQRGRSKAALNLETQPRAAALQRGLAPVRLGATARPHSEAKEAWLPYVG